MLVDRLFWGERSPQINMLWFRWLQYNQHWQHIKAEKNYLRYEYWSQPPCSRCYMAVYGIIKRSGVFFGEGIMCLLLLQLVFFICCVKCQDKSRLLLKTCISLRLCRSTKSHVERQGAAVEMYFYYFLIYCTVYCESWNATTYSLQNCTWAVHFPIWKYNYQNVSKSVKLFRKESLRLI